MQRASLYGVTVILITVMALIFVSCAKDENPVISNGSSRSAFTEYTEIVKKVAPPTYSGAQTAPGTIDPVWTDGQYAVLGKVFTDDGDQSLYGALEHLDMSIEVVNSMMAVDDSTGELLLKDSSWANFYDLTSATTIPTQAQTGLGMTSITLPKLIKVEWPEDPAGSVWDVAFEVDGDQQTMLMFRRNLWEGEWSTDVYYAWADVVDSAFDIRQVRYSDNGDGTVGKNILRISGDVHESFAYRMSWYAEDFGDQDGVGAIIGGGDKDVEFALKYREFVPADSSECQTCLEQVFGPNYTEGTGLISAYSQYLEESLLFLKDDMPATEPTSPWSDIQ